MNKSEKSQPKRKTLKSYRVLRVHPQILPPTFWKPERRRKPGAEQTRYSVTSLQCSQWEKAADLFLYYFSQKLWYSRSVSLWLESQVTLSAGEVKETGNSMWWVGQAPLG